MTGQKRNKNYSITIHMAQGEPLSFTTDSETLHTKMMEALSSRDTWLDFPPKNNKTQRINTNQITRIEYGEEACS